jgi:hypothetical protein
MATISTLSDLAKLLDRASNTSTGRGLSLYDQSFRRSVWNKGHPIAGHDPSKWVRDDYGMLLRWEDYGDKNSPFGWEMDHFPTPKALGGTDSIENMRPLHCMTNAQLGGLLGAVLAEQR